MMNLYIFNEKRRGGVFGVGTYILELVNTLKGSDINICVINLFSGKPQIQTEEIDGIWHWHFPAPIQEQQTLESSKQRALYLQNVVFLLQLHIEDKKGLIFHLNYYECGKLAEELKNAFDCRIVSVAHFCNWGFLVYDNLQRLRKILNEEQADSLGENLKKIFEEEKTIYRKVDQVICLSYYMQSILCRDYGLDATKISVILNGLIDVADMTTDRKLLRKKWNIPYKEKIILFAGRIDEVKGVSYLIKAFREVLDKLPNCRLIIAGSGNYATYFKEAKDICMKITFTGLLEKQELYELYRIADVGVTPSLFEPFGYVPVEMMMHGLPIVATATSGLNEVVDDTCGLKLPLTVCDDKVEIDKTILANHILYVLQHPVEAKRMGQNGRKRYLKNYSSEVFRQNMLQFYTLLYDTENYSSDMGRT